MTIRTKGRQLLWIALVLLLGKVSARPLVRHIRSTHEFERLLKKHATETGLPVIVDFYSDGCGPCRMMAPVFKNLAKEVGQNKAVFVKVDTNAMYELSSRYQIRSLPTFVFFLGGKKANQFSGAGEGQLRQITQQVIRQSELENVVLPKDVLVEYYAGVDASKPQDAIDSVYKKCADMTKTTDCVGAAANQLAKRLKKKYGQAPKTVERFSAQDRQPTGGDEGNAKAGASSANTKASAANKANLHLATMEELMVELEKRQDEEVDEQVEHEDDDEAEFEHGWTPGDFPERVTVIGGGPAGMSAAIYAARAGLTPVIVAPPMGGQLQGKGVDVENYPGLFNITGPGVISKMREQAVEWGASFEAETVLKVDASTRPFKVITNNSVIETHSIIVATGAESNWLGVPGEWEMRGGGVSSCATCDGAVFRGKDVCAVGGGDSAMEDALVLARTSKSVTLIHRRDSFRASKVLAQRVMEHHSISIRWNATVKEIVGKYVETSDAENDSMDLDDAEERQKVVTGVVLTDVQTNEEIPHACDAVFVAIGHSPTTSFLTGLVEFDEAHPGYIKTVGRSTKTSVPGIFAAGDVADSVYRQAITSAGSGAAAALDAERWLSEEGLGNEAAEFEAELLAEIMGGDEKVGAQEGYNAYDDAGGRVEGMKESLGSEL